MWNIRGCNDPAKQKEVKNSVNKRAIAMVVLVENKVKRKNVDMVCKNCCPHWEFIHNCMGERVGRVWIGWNPEVLEVEMFRLHEQTITVKVKEKGKNE